MLSKSTITKFTLTLTTLALSAHAHALLSLGIKGGMGFSTVSTNPSTASVDRGRGFLGGVSLDLNAGLVGVVVDALYAQRVYGSGADKASLKSLHLPAQVKFNLLPALFTSAGAYYAMGVGDNQAYTDLGLKSNDYGAVVGVGASLPMGIGAATAELRYNIGMANVLQNAPNSVSIKNRQIDLLVGLRF